MQIDLNKELSDMLSEAKRARKQAIRAGKPEVAVSANAQLVQIAKIILGYAEAQAAKRQSASSLELGDSGESHVHEWRWLCVGCGKRAKQIWLVQRFESAAEADAERTGERAPEAHEELRLPWREALPIVLPRIFADRYASDEWKDVARVLLNELAANQALVNQLEGKKTNDEPTDDTKTLAETARGTGNDGNETEGHGDQHGPGNAA